jgi:hypothetical protein
VLRRRSGRVVILAICALVAAPFVGTVPDAAAATLRFGTYDVTIRGTVDGVAFDRTGVLRLRRPFATSGTQNGANSVELCLRSGDPWTTPQPGAITLGSNSACFGGTAELDMGYVSTDRSTHRVLFEPDPDLAAVCINTYTRTSNVGAAVYAPYNGGMLVEFRNRRGRVIGAIDTNGLTNCVSAGGSRYTAEFTGKLRT